MRKYMKLYASTMDAVEALTDEDAGRVLKGLLRYMNDAEPGEMQGSDKVLFLMLRQQIERDVEIAVRNGRHDYN